MEMPKLKLDELHCEPIKTIDCVKNLKKNEFIIETKKGTKVTLSKVNRRPQKVLFVNGDGLVTVPKDFVPVQHKEILDAILAECKEQEITPISVEITHPDKYSCSMRVIIAENTDIQKNDPYSTGIYAVNSYALSRPYQSLTVGQFLLRQVCTNGLMGERRNISRRIPESQDKTFITNNIKLATKSAIEKVLDTTELLATLNKANLKPHQVDYVLKRMKVSKKDIKDMKLDEAKTQYDLLNEITQLANIKTENRAYRMQTKVLATILNSNKLDLQETMQGTPEDWWKEVVTT